MPQAKTWLSDPAVFSPGSEINHKAMVSLAELLREAGFWVHKKRAQESTLRVYLDRQHKYPLLNPRFVKRSLEITVLSKDRTADLPLEAARTVPGCEAQQIDKPSGGYWCHGVIRMTIDPKDELRASLPDLRKLHDLLVNGWSTFSSAIYSPDRAVPARGSWISFDEELPQHTHIEGARMTILVNRYERDPKARQECIDRYGSKCAVCGFTAADRYGNIGLDLIQVHHLRPLSDIGKEYEIDPVRDLIPLCPNCHAAIHSRKPARTIDELKAMLQTGK